MLHSQGRYSGLAYFSLPGQLLSWQSSLKRIFLSTFISSYMHNKAFGLMVQTFDGNSVCFCHSDTKMQWFCFTLRVQLRICVENVSVCNGTKRLWLLGTT